MSKNYHLSRKIAKSPYNSNIAEPQIYYSRIKNLLKKTFSEYQKIIVKLKKKLKIAEYSKVLAVKIYKIW